MLEVGAWPREALADGTYAMTMQVARDVGWAKQRSPDGMTHEAARAFAGQMRTRNASSMLHRELAIIREGSWLLRWPDAVIPARLASGG